MLKDVFGFAEHQEKATSGLGCKMVLTKNVDNAVLNKDNATNKAKIKINAMDGVYCILHPLFQISLY